MNEFQTSRLLKGLLERERGKIQRNVHLSINEKVENTTIHEITA
jgi:hypothetical protein